MPQARVRKKMGFTWRLRINPFLLLAGLLILNSGMAVYTTSVWCRIAVTEYETQDKVFSKISQPSGEDSLSGLGLITLMKRPVRSRMRGVVGAGGEKPPATRLCFFICFIQYA